MAVELFHWSEPNRPPCRLNTIDWRHAIELAKEFGWNARGAVPSQITTEFYSHGGTWDGDYLSSAFQVVGAEDALEFALALERARSALPEQPDLTKYGVPDHQSETFEVALAHIFAPRDWFAFPRGKELLKHLIEFLWEGPFVIG